MRVGGVTVAEKSGAVKITTSSMSMEIKAIAEVLAYLEENACRKAVIVTDSMSTLQKIRKKMLHVDWISHINASNLQALTWIRVQGTQASWAMRGLIGWQAQLKSTMSSLSTSLRSKLMSKSILLRNDPLPPQTHNNSC